MKVVTVRMRRLTGTTLGTLAIVVVVVLGIALGSVFALPLNAHSARSGGSPVAVVSHPGIHVQPAATYTVTFSETLLPATTVWSVSYNGTKSAAAPGSIAFPAIPNGTAHFEVLNSTPGFAASPGFGTVTVAGAAVTVAITFHPTFFVTFNETGLPDGTAWTVTLNGTPVTTTTAFATFSEPAGAYTYTVANTSGFLATPYAGTATVVAGNLQVAVSFAAGVVPTVTVLWSTTFTKLYTVAPFPVFFNITVAGTPINGKTTTVAITFRDLTHRVNTNTFDLPVGAGQTAYTFNVTNSTVSGLPVALGSQYQITATVTAVNLQEPVGLSASKSASIVNNLIFASVHGEFVAPVGAHALGPGNVTVVVSYGGDFINNAQVTIYKGTTTSGASAVLVFKSPTFSPGTVNRTVSAISPWLATTAGTYTEVLSIGVNYALTFINFTQTITISTVGGVVYFNTTSPVSLIPGLSSAAGGTLLLVVGLAVGMAVALVLGRMMWGTPKAAPAQAWAPAAGTNECSVCHQSFPTEEALKDHQKSAHGM